MLESDNNIQCNMINYNTKEIHCDINQDEYNRIYNKKRLQLFFLKLCNLCAKGNAIYIELFLLNKLREEILSELSTTNIIINNILLFCIFCQIEEDKILLDGINNIKQQLELIKQKDIETLKRLSKTIK